MTLHIFSPKSANNAYEWNAETLKQEQRESKQTQDWIFIFILAMQVNLSANIFIRSWFHVTLCILSPEFLYTVCF